MALSDEPGLDSCCHWAFYLRLCRARTFGDKWDRIFTGRMHEDMTELRL